MSPSSRYDIICMQGESERLHIELKDLAQYRKPEIFSVWHVKGDVKVCFSVSGPLTYSVHAVTSCTDWGVAMPVNVMTGYLKYN